jgi:hypothetical protein
MKMKTNAKTNNKIRVASVPVLAEDGKTFLTNCEQGKARRLIKCGRAVIFPLGNRYAIRMKKRSI